MILGQRTKRKLSELDEFANALKKMKNNSFTQKVAQTSTSTRTLINLKK